MYCLVYTCAVYLGPRLEATKLSVWLTRKILDLVTPHVAMSINVSPRRPWLRSATSFTIARANKFVW